MGIFSKFEDKMEDTVEGAASRMSKAPITPVQIAKKAEKQMRRETMVGAGKEYAPTLYTVLVNPEDDARLFGYYPTLAGETETYLKAKAAQEGLVMDGSPLVRFIVDERLRHGKCEVIAEAVSAPIIRQLRDEEMQRYGLAPRGGQASNAGRPRAASVPDARFPDAWDDPYAYEQPQPQVRPPLPYVPEDEIDRSIDYGEYTFNSEDFEDYRGKVEGDVEPPVAYNEPHQPQAQGAMRPANTVAFTPGAAERAALPDRQNVRARLVDRARRRSYDLAGAHITLGRDASNDIAVDDINASRRHAELRLNQQGLWVVTDLTSMNGTLVNGVSVASQPLYPGDVVTIGKTDFEFALM